MLLLLLLSGWRAAAARVGVAHCGGRSGRGHDHHVVMDRRGLGIAWGRGEQKGVRWGGGEGRAGKGRGVVVMMMMMLRMVSH